jgi:hypothetical protein
MVWSRKFRNGGGCPATVGLSSFETRHSETLLISEFSEFQVLASGRPHGDAVRDIRKGSSFGVSVFQRKVVINIAGLPLAFPLLQC